VRGLRGAHASNLYDLLYDLYDLMIGLVEKPLLRAVLRETGGESGARGSDPGDQSEYL
jgi:DNA-binding protein Fis